MFCENYVEACGGAPDVIAWDGEQKKYQLVHIQGPGYPNTQSKKVESTCPRSFTWADLST
jgi:hypothetical protein